MFLVILTDMTVPATTIIARKDFEDEARKVARLSAESKFTGEMSEQFREHIASCLRTESKYSPLDKSFIVSVHEVSELDWSKIYDGAACPDCETAIPTAAAEGDECKVCGHVFWQQQAVDD